MLRYRRARCGARWPMVVLSFLVVLPVTSRAEDVPAPVLALLPAGATFGHGDWSLLTTEFGRTFTADVYADAFPGRTPSCDLDYVPRIAIHLKGDTAFEEPPMLEMAVASYEQDVASSASAMASFAAGYTVDPAAGITIGDVQAEQLPNGQTIAVEYQENCRVHPNGGKTSLYGFARRGATQLNIDLVVALDAAAAKALASDIFQRFQQLDIESLTGD